MCAYTYTYVYTRIYMYKWRHICIKKEVLKKASMWSPACSILSWGRSSPTMLLDSFSDASLQTEVLSFRWTLWKPHMWSDHGASPLITKGKFREAPPNSARLISITYFPPSMCTYAYKCFLEDSLWYLIFLLVYSNILNMFRWDSQG